MHSVISDSYGGFIHIQYCLYISLLVLQPQYHNLNKKTIYFASASLPWMHCSSKFKCCKFEIIFISMLMYYCKISITEHIEDLVIISQQFSWLILHTHIPGQHSTCVKHWTFSFHQHNGYIWSILNYASILNIHRLQD